MTGTTVFLCWNYASKMYIIQFVIQYRFCNMHQVQRCSFADFSCVSTGVDKATAILERCEKEYPKSALFLFFNAKIHRLKAGRRMWVNMYLTSTWHLIELA